MTLSNYSNNPGYYQLISEDLYLHAPEKLSQHLYECLINNTDCIIDTFLEAYDFKITGLYQLLDEFVKRTGYQAHRITLITGNMVAAPYRYKIIKKPEYWYEVYEISKWLNSLPSALDAGQNPIKHFGNFSGRSTWYRIWIGSILFNHYKDKTIQTFHSGFHCNYVVPTSTTVVDDIGLNDLNYYNCDCWTDIVNFLNNCPLNVSESELDNIRSDSMFVPATNNGCYPIQHPSNLRVLNYYRDIFVDIVCETRVAGDNFFISEKTARAFVAKRPFILMGCRESLLNLKKLGFKTFSKWWDESYDDYGERDRVIKILDVIDYISCWPIEKLHKTLIEMNDILEHNYQLYYRLTAEDIGNTFYD